MRQAIGLWPGIAAAFALMVYFGAAARAQTPPVPTSAAGEITLPSALPSGNPSVDTIHFRFSPAENGVGDAPAVVLVPPTGSDQNEPRMRRLAAFLVKNGVHVALITLPYHGIRKLSGLAPAGAFVGYDVERNARAFAQSASDISEVVTWLQKQPGVDKSKIGVAGLSLGAIVTHLAMGKDERINGGVAIVGGGDLPDLYRRSTLARTYRLFHPAPVRYDPESRFRLLSPSDPLTYADKNRPRRVLMVQAARDLLIPPRDATELWEALGRPPIRWVDTNHFALGFAIGPVERAALFYLRGVWAGKSDNELNAALPRVSAPLFKGGFLTQFGQGSELGFTPDVQWQFASLGHQRSHSSLFHADLGFSGRGPFVAVGATVNAFVDVGVASRFAHSFAPPRPYLSFHVAY